MSAVEAHVQQLTVRQQYLMGWFCLEMEKKEQSRHRIHLTITLLRAGDGAALLTGFDPGPIPQPEARQEGPE